MAFLMHWMLPFACLVMTQASCGTMSGPGLLHQHLNQTVVTQMAAVADSDDEEVEGPPTPPTRQGEAPLLARTRLLQRVGQLWEDGQEELVYMMEYSLAERARALPPHSRLHVLQAHAVLALYGVGRSTSPLPPAWARWLDILLEEWLDQLPWNSWRTFLPMSGRISCR